MSHKVKPIIIVGSGGLAREVIWIIEEINLKHRIWEIIGFLDNYKSPGEIVASYPVLGCDDKAICYKDAYFICAIASSRIRSKIVERLLNFNPEIKFATLIHPSAVHSESILIGEGVIIGAGSILTIDITLGNHVIINNACTIGHDAYLHEYTTLYPGVNISGNCILKSNVEIGTGAQVIQGITIEKNTIVGAGSVVIRDLPANCTAVGIPAKPIKYN